MGSSFVACAFDVVRRELNISRGTNKECAGARHLKKILKQSIVRQVNIWRQVANSNHKAGSVG